MGRSRRARRRIERQRARRAQPARRLGFPLRSALILGGIGLVVAGALLLTAGSSANAARLGRLAGILILLGIVAIVVGGIGRL